MSKFLAKISKFVLITLVCTFAFSSWSINQVLAATLTTGTPEPTPPSKLNEKEIGIIYAPETQATDEDKKNIENLLASLERSWNNHDLKTVMEFYSSDYYNNDGFDKKTISSLTQKFWEEYPDIKSSSTTKTIRIEGQYATVSSRDIAEGTTAKELIGLNTKGEFKSTSEGQLYLKHLANTWTIIGDRIDFEKMTIGYGLARQLDPIFSAPEQVRAGKQFCAKLEVELPAGLTAIGSITETNVQYPPPPPPESWKSMVDTNLDHPLLERVMYANTNNKNELLMGTIVLTNSSKNSVLGLSIVTRRLNVIANSNESTITTKPKH